MAGRRPKPNRPRRATIVGTARQARRSGQRAVAFTPLGRSPNRTALRLRDPDVRRLAPALALTEAHGHVTRPFQ